MTEIAGLILIVASATFAIRLSGILLGRKIPTQGFWAESLNALPGCLIVSLVAMLIISGGINELIAGLIALVVAILSKNLPLTMLAGIASIIVLR